MQRPHHRRVPPHPAGGDDRRGSSFVAADQGLHTVFTVNAGDDTLSAINTRTCRGTVTSGCRTRPPSQQATPHQGPGFNSFAERLRADPPDRLRVRSERGRGQHPVGDQHQPLQRRRHLRLPPPGAPACHDGEFLLSVDPATDTIYGGNQNTPEIDVINGATCQARRPGRLRRRSRRSRWPTRRRNVGAIDDATHTLYAADPYSDTVSVINTATCNAAAPPAAPPRRQSSRSARSRARRSSTGLPGRSTCPTATNGNRVAVVNAATCNATDTSGCGQHPGRGQGRGRHVRPRGQRRRPTRSTRPSDCAATRSP